MTPFGIALASIAMVLVNLGIGWALAKRHSRRHVGPAARRLLRRDHSAE